MNRQARLLAVGETMALVAPLDGTALETADRFLLDAGGAESNVASHVAALGHTAAWFSRLGHDALGDRILLQLAARGIDVSGVQIHPDAPTGVYFKDPGRRVLYYRQLSAASTLDRDEAASVDLDSITVLHVSGITAAISCTARDFLTALIDRARRAGILVSFDVNYRPALWSAAAAAPILASVARTADLVLVGRDEAETLWGTPAAAAIHQLLRIVPELVIKDAHIGATAYRGDEEAFVPALPVEVLEPIGAGDAFAGGYLSEVLAGTPDLTQRLAAGHTRAALTLTAASDFIDERIAL